MYVQDSNINESQNAKYKIQNTNELCGTIVDTRTYVCEYEVDIP